MSTNIRSEELDKLIVISTNTVAATNGLNKVNREIIEVINKQSDVIKMHSNDISNIKADIDDIKLTSELDNSQLKHIRKNIRSKVREVCGYPSIYYHKFISDLYKYLKNYHNMGSEVAATEKQYYKSIITAIEAYSPNVEQIKNDHDNYLIEMQR